MKKPGCIDGKMRSTQSRCITQFFTMLRLSETHYPTFRCLAVLASISIFPLYIFIKHKLNKISNQTPISWHLQKNRSGNRFKITLSLTPLTLSSQSGGSKKDDDIKRLTFARP